MTTGGVAERVVVVCIFGAMVIVDGAPPHTGNNKRAQAADTKAKVVKTQGPPTSILRPPDHSVRLSDDVTHFAPDFPELFLHPESVLILLTFSIENSNRSYRPWGKRS